MLSAATLRSLSTQPDVNDQEIDALVKYADDERHDAWVAIKLMHECGQDGMISNYLMRLQDPKLLRLGIILPSLWRRVDARQAELQRLQAIADAQPESMQEHRSALQMMESVSSWMRNQDTEVCTTTICQAIEATAKANKVRCKQDWAGIIRLIRDEGEWIKGLTNIQFIKMVTDHCHIDPSLQPTESSLKVLSFGTQKFPSWKVSSYKPQQISSLVQMAKYLLEQIDIQVQKARQLEQKTAPYGIIRLT